MNTMDTSTGPSGAGGSDTSPGLAQLLVRVRDLVDQGSGRVLLGIAGKPGSGKSTLAARLAAAIDDGAAGTAVVVPMDGFHLSNARLRELGLADVKGAPQTFDVDGLAALLERVAAQRPGDPVVYAPSFDRDLEEAVAGSIPVLAQTPVVIVEGSYLLLDEPGWRSVRGHLSEVWFVDPPDEVRVPRLVDRHVRHGRAPSAARAWVQRSDEANARLVAASRAAADLLVR